MEYTELKDIPLDFDPTKSKIVVNPLAEDFSCHFGGVEQTLKAGEKKIMPEPVAAHVAKHLADKICRDKHIELLQEKFEGLDESGREKWRVNEQILITRDDVSAVAKTLIFDAQVGVTPEATVPETRFEKMTKGVKASKKESKKEKPE